MPRRKRRSRLPKIFHLKGLDPAGLLDWLTMIFLGLTLFVTTWQLGGFVPLGYVGISLVWLLPLLVLLHSLWWVANPQRPRRFHPMGLILIPLALYTLGRNSFGSIAPWEARLESLGPLAMAIVFWIALHHGQTRKRQWWLLGLTVLSALLALGLGLFQYFALPGWLPAGLRTLPTEPFSASGPFPLAGALPVMLMAWIPLFLLLAGAKRIPLGGRLMAGYMGLVLLLGPVIAPSFAGLGILLGCLLTVPLLAAHRKRDRLKRFRFGALLVILLVSLAAVFGANLRERFPDRLWGEPPRAEVQLDEISPQLLWSQPLIGKGGGAFRTLWEQYRPLGADASLAYPPSDVQAWLVDYGILGLLLLLMPLFLVIFHTFRAWRALPWEADTTDPHRKGRARGPRSQRQPVPTRKLLLAGLFLGLTATVFLVFFAPGTRLLAIAFQTALLMAIALRWGRNREVALSSIPFFKGIALAVGILLAGFLYQANLPPALAAKANFRGEMILRQLSQDRDILFEESTLPEAAQIAFREAISLQPDHGDAWAGLARSILWSSWIDPSRLEGVVRASEEPIERAITLAPNNPQSWVAKALRLAQDNRFEEAREAFREAVERGPQDGEIWFLYAEFLAQERGQQEEARQAIFRAISLGHQTDAALRLQSTLRL